MNRASGQVIPAIALAAALGCWVGTASSDTAAKPLAEEMPRGAIVYLEARNFSSMLRDWNASPVKQAWLKSDNYRAFLLSRLALRLEQAQREFAAAAGLPPDGKLLAQVAGKNSALALYDIGKLQFLYIARLTPADAMQSELWQARGKFETRSVGGVGFFVHSDPQSGRVVAFAVTRGCLLLATREDILAGALELLAGGSGSSLGGEHWYKQAIAAAGAPGELRLVLRMDKVAASPYFRSYWIQRNISAMRRYESAVSDFDRDGPLFREERVLLHKSPPQVIQAGAASQAAGAPAGARQVADLLRLVPPDATFYRAVANPGVDESLALLRTKILFPHTGPVLAGTAAPTVILTGGVVGRESDLETRIDVPPFALARGANGWEALRKLLQDSDVQAALLMQSAAEDPETAFLENHSTVVLAAGTDWNADAIRAALTGAIRQEITTGGLGAGWMDEGAKSDGYFALEGLLPAVLAVRGKVLVVSNHPGSLAAVLARTKAAPSAEPAAYAAGFLHRAERQNFAHLTDVLDSWLLNGRTPDSGFRGRPPFFSGNLVSLSRVLAGVDSESVVVRESGGETRQTIVYRWNH
jgi:hypothetical protein